MMRHVNPRTVRSLSNYLENTVWIQIVARSMLGSFADAARHTQGLDLIVAFAHPNATTATAESIENEQASTPARSKHGEQSVES